MEHSKANTIDNNVKQTSTNEAKLTWREWKEFEAQEEKNYRANRQKNLKQSEYISNLAHAEAYQWQKANRGGVPPNPQHIASGGRDEPFWIAWKCEGNPIYNTHRPRGKKMTPDCGKWSYKRATELPETAHADGRRAMARCQHCGKKASLISRNYRIFDTKVAAKSFVEGLNEQYQRLYDGYKEWLD